MRNGVLKRIFEEEENEEEVRYVPLSLQEQVEKHCIYEGFGEFRWGDQYCEKECPLSDACRSRSHDSREEVIC